MNTTTRQEVFLHPGDWHFGGRETVIRTLLGSCVSITLWHPRLLVGGMCHYLLARRNDRQETRFSGRYGDEAMLLMLREVLATGRPLKEFKAKLIGGAAVLSSIERDLPAHDVPARNIDMARSLAQQLGLSVQAEDLGGNSPRVVLFDVESGDVWVKQSQESELAEAAPSKTTRKKT
ncbi:chemotaxis protein CheD [uncultured Aquitalea sp.]|uniref:chemotaxis protein CheD n=1 Tax=uncultured Aquitalea sp. TaxID=540272 RepID=UPI0025E2E356|nr:chemotaxis protein CheD [uncultured Aquitalea sp.]